LLNKIVNNKSVYALSTNLELLPAAYYSNFTYASQFMDFCWFAGFEKERKFASKKFYTHPVINENYFINKVAEELNAKKPEFVLVNTLDNKLFFSYQPFDFLATFLKNDNFRSAWKSYHYLTRLEDYSSQLYSTRDWGLYLMPDLNSKINLDNIPNDYVVILTGNSNPRTAYYTAHKQFIYSKFGRIEQKVFLTEDELKNLANKNGLLSLNSNNEKMINSVISKSINAPAHRMEVYQREK
jgi:hypothetical protein